MWSEKRNKCELHTLSNGEYNYLTRRETGESYPADMERSIKKKTNRIDERIQYLIEDLVLLDKTYNDLDCSTSHLKPDLWSEVWDSLSRIDRQDAPYNPPFHLSHMGADPIELENVSIGINFGHILHLIRRNADAESTLEEVALGFLLGLCGQGLDQSILESGRGVETAPVNRSHSETPMNHFQVSGELRSALRKCIDLLQASMTEVPREEMHSAYLEVLDEEGFSVSPQLIGEVHDIAEDEKFRYDWDLWGGVDINQDIYYIIAELDRNTDFTKSRAMASMIKEDIQHLKNTYWRDQSLYQIDLLQAVSRNEPTSDAELGQLVEAADQVVRKLLNDLMGTGTSPGPWEERPLIYRQTDYRTTKYGKVVAEILEMSEPDEESNGVFSSVSFVDNPIIAACHAYGLRQTNEEQDELFSDAIQEIEDREKEEEEGE